MSRESSEMLDWLEDVLYGGKCGVLAEGRVCHRVERGYLHIDVWCDYLQYLQYIQ